MGSAPGSSGICGAATPSRATPCWSRSRGRRIIRLGAPGGGRRSDRAPSARSSTTPGGTVARRRSRSHLRDLPGLPHESTIWRILTARGLIVADPSKAPKHTGRSFTAERANECWALDDWTWALADGTGGADPRRRSMITAATPWPRTAMPTCTGAATLRRHRRRRQLPGLAATVLVRQRPSLHRHPGHRPGPARCGRQPHPALQPATATARSNGSTRPCTSGSPSSHPPPPSTELQAQLDLFRTRLQHPPTPPGPQPPLPRRRLDRRPQERTRRPAPRHPTTVHHSTVHAGRCYAGRYAITVGTAHNGQRALTVITGTAAHVFIDGHLIRQLTLNPTNRTQPLHPAPADHLP